MREGKGDNQDHGGEVPEDVQSEIDALLAKRREQLEAELENERAHLVKVATLTAERRRVQQAWDEAQDRLSQLDKELAKLTGKPAASGGGKKDRNRLDVSQFSYKGVADAIERFVGEQKEPVASAPIKEYVAKHFSGYDVGNVKGFLIKYGPTKVKPTGDRSQTRYHV